MKLGKVARAVGILGGIGAIGWAMRERFVTLTLTREPEPPTFTLPPDADDELATDPDDLTEINGIGPVFARRLMEAGVATFGQLATAELANVVAATNVPNARANRWIEQAQALVDGSR